MPLVSLAFNLSYKRNPVFSPYSENYKVFNFFTESFYNQMKKLIAILSISAFTLVSCSKNVNSPSGTDAQNIFFQTPNVAVSNFTVTSASIGAVEVSFSTLYETGIQQIEILSSASTDHFCTTKTFTVSGNSTQQKQYNYQDTNIKGSTMYYMLRFKDANGNWNYSDYFTIENVQ